MLQRQRVWYIGTGRLHKPIELHHFGVDVTSLFDCSAYIGIQYYRLEQLVRFRHSLDLPRQLVLGDHQAVALVGDTELRETK